MDETDAATPNVMPPNTPDAIAADKLATQFHWPARLGTFDGWARFADCGMPPEPPAQKRARIDE